jgi:cathepsin B
MRIVEKLLIPTLISLTFCNRRDYLRITERVNQGNFTWTASLDSSFNFDDDTKIKSLTSGGLDSSSFIESDFPSSRPRFLQQSALQLSNKSYPLNLDIRLKYTQCKSLSLISDQFQCSSCWAVSAMNVISDAYCISKSTGQQTAERHFSYQDSLACCKNCYATPEVPCNGGYLYQVFRYAQTQGVVTGDNSSSTNLCRPYFLSQASPIFFSNPECLQTCNPLSTVASYTNDKFKISSFKYGKGTSQMVAALNDYGSIAVTMTVYQDLITYNNGIYTKTTNTVLGGHAVRIIGYGVQEGVEFWIVANSWGVMWGEQGTFRIRKGSNECGIELGYFFYAII